MTKDARTAYPLRLPDELKTLLEEAAARSGKTLRSEILDRLWMTFGQTGGSESVKDVFADLEDIKIRLTALEAASTKSKKPSS